MRVEAMKHYAWALFALLWLMLSGALLAAGQAQPLADDPELEARVIGLSQKLRCLVCQNETIAASRAPLAIDLRNQVREQLAAGHSEREVVDFMVSRYGDFVLYTPPFRASTLLLWLGPGLLGVLGLGWLALRLRRREREQASPALSAAERAQARALLGEEDSSAPPPESRS